MKEPKISVMKIARIGPYLGRQLQKQRLTHQNQKRLQNVQSPLWQARTRIILKPRNYCMCIAMLPKMDALPEGYPSQFALAP